MNLHHFTQWFFHTRAVQEDLNLTRDHGESARKLSLSRVF